MSRQHSPKGFWFIDQMEISKSLFIIECNGQGEEKVLETRLETVGVFSGSIKPIIERICAQHNKCLDGVESAAKNKAEFPQMD